MRGNEAERWIETGPSWMESDDWADAVEKYRRQGRSSADIAEIKAMLEARGPRRRRSRAELQARSVEIGTVTRAVFETKEDEKRFLTRDADGLPTIRVVDAGDRLAIWSPVEGGGLINPKGPGLRTLGLVCSYARGTEHYPAFRAADLRKGARVELRAEPDNPYDERAVAMSIPGARDQFGYVQKGKAAAAVSRRLQEGEEMSGFTLWGPGPRRDDDSAFVLIGNADDIAAMRS